MNCKFTYMNGQPFNILLIDFGDSTTQTINVSVPYITLPKSYDSIGKKTIFFTSECSSCLSDSFNVNGNKSNN